MVIGASSTIYTTNKVKKTQYRKPHVAQQVLNQNQTFRLLVPLHRASSIEFFKLISSQVVKQKSLDQLQEKKG